MRKVFLITFFINAVACTTALHAQYPIEDSSIIATDREEEYIIRDIDTSLYFTEHPVIQDSIRSWKNARAFAYTKYLDSLLKEQQRKKDAAATKTSAPSGPSTMDNFFASKGLSVFLWILAGIFVIFILYKLFLAEGIFKRNRTSKDEKVAPVAEEEAITAESDFERLIRLALAGGNYRLATRYQYLQTLHQLAEKQYIGMAADKTNFQYVQEIKNEKIRNDFSSLTLNYEYVWYGEFQIEGAIYQKLVSAFEAFSKKI